MFGWRLVPEDLLSGMTVRIRELEKQNTSLIDRLLESRGVPPASPEGMAEFQVGQEVAQQIFEELMTDGTEEVVEEVAGRPDGKTGA